MTEEIIDFTDAKLNATRDLLLPALRKFESMEPAISFEIKPDYQTKSLIVIGRLRSYELGFAITRESIRDRHYIEAFEPNMLGLIRILTESEQESAA